MPILPLEELSAASRVTIPTLSAVGMRNFYCFSYVVRTTIIMPTKSNTSYFKALSQAVGTTLKGAQLTLTHLKDAVFRPKVPATYASEDQYFEKSNKGSVTLRYPFEELPVPAHGRYQLHNEIDDCIVCDKCAKVCPVNCIDIEAVKSPEVIGETSDGTPKRLHAAKFDIDMAKCCFCGLCTTVCPTECLTMTDDYDFSGFDVNEMNFKFSEMTAEEVAEKERIYAEAQAEKKAKALAAKQAKAEQEAKDQAGEGAAKPKPRPKFRPKVKAKPKEDSVVKKEGEEKEESGKAEEEAPKKPRPKFKPRMKKPPKTGNDDSSGDKS